MAARLFISWFLHQTTTQNIQLAAQESCLSLDSYIKPQLQPHIDYFSTVVYLLIPTSNHNTNSYIPQEKALFISWFLHQTTTLIEKKFLSPRCLSLDSYIKPQRDVSILVEDNVVYLLIPTSNHNHRLLQVVRVLLFISWFLHQTTTR